MARWEPRFPAAPCLDARPDEATPAGLSVHRSRIAFPTWIPRTRRATRGHPPAWMLMTRRVPVKETFGPDCTRHTSLSVATAGSAVTHGDTSATRADNSLRRATPVTRFSIGLAPASCSGPRPTPRVGPAGARSASVHSPRTEGVRSGERQGRVAMTSTGRSCRTARIVAASAAISLTLGVGACGGGGGDSGKLTGARLTAAIVKGLEGLANGHIATPQTTSRRS